MGKKTGDAVVRIDAGLLDEVEAFINLEENAFRYVNRKQFIDLAVSDFLRHNRDKKRGRKNGKY